MKSRFRLLACFVFAGLSIAASSGHARADDTADEADFHFQRGAERYQAGDYRDALEHFLASNRLAPNRNVVFNIAKAYEQLGRLPDAFRYYSAALEGETDPGDIQRIGDAIAKLRERVAVVHVVTDPPGATVYLERKDLGARGVAPKQLGVAAGTYRVIAELPGYEPAQMADVVARVGATSEVRLKLVRIVGTLELSALPGAEVRIGHEGGALDCLAPCSVATPPGRQSVFVTKPGFAASEVLVDIVANQTIKREIKLTAVVGNLVVNSDVQNALITVDGQARGFTPAVLNLAVGMHDIRVSAQGFRAQERKVEINQTKQATLDFELSSVEEVSAASRSSEATEDAPASVTVISAQEIKAMGYPTIAEALRGIRGLYVASDDVYASLGVRGVSNPGSYGNRVLILVDGHPTNDNYIWSSYLGFDTRADLEDVERIEVVRGAGSVLYGTGAFLGVINVVTRSRSNPTHAELGVSTALGAGRARAHVTWRASPDAGLWLSVAGTRSTGNDKYYPDYVGAKRFDGAVSDGVVRDADGHSSLTVAGRTWYKALTVQWSLNAHDKDAASAQYGTLLGRASRNNDTRAFVEARFEPQITATLQSLSRAHLNYYGYDNRLPFAAYDKLDPACAADPSACSYGTEVDRYRGVWAGAEQRFQWTPRAGMRITLGGELIRHFTTLQVGDDGRSAAAGSPLFDPNIPPERKTGSIIRRDDPFTSVAIYANGDFQLHPKLRISAGARLDDYSGLIAKFDFVNQFSPRLALIAKAYPSGTSKIVLGKAFRVPSVYESYYRSATQIAAAGLVPEQIYSAELEHTHRFSQVWVGSASAFASYVTNLIELNRGVEGGLKQYQNSKAPTLVLGAELEVRREWRQGWMFAANYSLQRASYNDSSLQAADKLREVPSTPTQLAAFKAAMPLIGKTLMLGARLALISATPDLQRNQFCGKDPTTNANISCPAQGTTEFGANLDIVFSGEAERYGLKYAVGLYNAADWKYDAVPSAEYTQRTIRQPGRSVLATLTWNFDLPFLDKQPAAR